jgi:hypothetical protein
MLKPISIFAAFLMMGTHATAQRIGIQTSAPTAPLSFANINGNKISLSGNAATGHFGIGLIANEMAFYMPDTAKGIVFAQGGFGKWSLYTSENSVKVNCLFADANPDAMVHEPKASGKLNIFGSLRLRHDVPYETAGIWYNTPDNNELAFFMGLQSGSMWHIDRNAGPNPGSRFGIDLTNGAMRINGSFGYRGQLLVSNGGTQPAAWNDGPMNKVYNANVEKKQTSSLLVNTTNTTGIPNLTLNPNLPVASKMRLFYNLAVEAPSCLFCSNTDFQVSVVLNGVVVRTYQHSIENNTSSTFTGSFFLSVAASSPVINIVIRKISGPDILLPVSGSIWSSVLLDVTPAS